MTDNYRPLSRNNRGPRSRKGKTAVVVTQLRHGLDSGEIVLPGEDPAKWSAFHDDVLARFEPDGPVETALASRVAELLWRLRRIARAEQQSVGAAQVHRDALVEDREYAAAAAAAEAGGQPEPPGDDPDPEEIARRRQVFKAKFGIYTDVVIAGMASSRYRETQPVWLPDDHTLDRLIRYEAHLTRALNHALHELEALQDRRHGKPTPLARIDIS